MLRGRIGGRTAVPLLALGLCVLALAGFEPRMRGLAENSLIDVLVSREVPNGLRVTLALIVVLALWFVSRVLNSPFGAVIETIRENEKRAAACGYDVARSKWLAFVLSAGICGLAGALRAIHLSIVPIDSLHYLQSGQVVMMSLLGGMGTFFGPFVGAAVFLYLEDIVTNATRYWMAVVGVVFILFVLFFPRGIWGSLMNWLERWEARR